MEAAVAAARVDLVRPADWICDATICALIFGNNLVYRDNTHITATFSSFLAPILGWELDYGP